MASKVKVTFNIVLVSITIIIGSLVKRSLPISNETKLYLGYRNESLLNFTELSASYNYDSEEHTVVTEDGYILTVFRVFTKKCKRLKSPPVLLMHGLLQSADAWIDAGPTSGLPYLLADSCYDVWVGNQRGNYYARRHKTLNPDRDASFWKFSVDEIGFYDVPATIDYVLKYSKVPKLNFLGYSQGSGTFFIMCSERQGYCDKVKIHIGLAPAARQTHSRSVIYRGLTNMLVKLDGMLSAAGYNEVMARGALGQEFLSFLCFFTFRSEKFCGTVESMFDSYHPGSINNETLHNMFGHFPAGTSLKNLVRYGQSMNSKKFEKYDYGTSNSKVYGTDEPPEYNLTAVTVPMVIIFGKNDHLVDIKDLRWLVKRLPKVLEVIEIKDPLWNHFDCTYSQHINEMILPNVKKYLDLYSA